MRLLAFTFAIAVLLPVCADNLRIAVRGEKAKYSIVIPKESPPSVETAGTSHSHGIAGTLMTRDWSASVLCGKVICSEPVTTAVAMSVPAAAPVITSR